MRLGRSAFLTLLLAGLALVVALPFTGARTSGLLLTGLSLAATGLLVFALARTTRTP